MARRLLLLAMGMALALPAVADARSSIVDVPLTPGLLPILQRSFDVTHDVTAARARVVIHDDGQRARLAALTPSREVVRDVHAAMARRAGASKGALPTGLPSGRGGYRVPADYEAELTDLLDDKPGLARAVAVGTSVEGRPITGIELAKDVGRTGDGRPVFLAFGLHHAREWASGEVTMEFARDLVQRYGSDPRWTALLERVRVIAVPVVNPDGFVVSRGENPLVEVTPGVMHRRNCAPVGDDDPGGACGAEKRGVDLNRNYGAGWGGIGASTSASSDTYRGPGPFSEPESSAVHELSRRLQVMGVQSTHNIAGEVLRQPGFKDYGLLTPDEPRFKALGASMAEATGYANKLGYELYDVHGATEDWNYIEQGALGYTVELGPQSSPWFNGPGTFQTHVVDQYLGGGAGGPAGRGMREALLVAAEAAAEVGDHAVLRGSATPGAVLKVRRDFTTDTVAVCPDSACTTPGPVVKVPDHAETTLTVEPSGVVDWHLTPSTRPWEAKAGRSEAWTLTCEISGSVVTTKSVTVGRADLALVDPCDPESEVVVKRNPDAPPLPPPPAPDAPGAPGTPAPGAPAAPRAPASTRVAAPTLSVAGIRRSTFLRRGLRARVRCAAACTGRLSARIGRLTIAGRAVTLRASGTRSVLLRPSRSGRRVLRRTRATRLDVRLAISGRRPVLRRVPLAR